MKCMHLKQVNNVWKTYIYHLLLSQWIISMDYSLPDISGEDLLAKIKKINSNIHVIILSGQKDIATAIDLLKKGAADYITKDKDTKDRLWNSVNLLKENVELAQENPY